MENKWSNFSWFWTHSPCRDCGPVLACWRLMPSTLSLKAEENHVTTTLEPAINNVILQQRYHLIRQLNDHFHNYSSTKGYSPHAIGSPVFLNPLHSCWTSYYFWNSSSNEAAFRSIRSATSFLMVMTNSTSFIHPIWCFKVGIMQAHEWLIVIARTCPKCIPLSLPFQTLKSCFIFLPEIRYRANHD